MATYHLLPQSPNHHHHQHHHPRKALSFAILILLVATATLITIIRFTVNPNLNGQTFVQPTNAFAKERAHRLAEKFQHQPQSTSGSDDINFNNHPSVQPSVQQQQPIILLDKQETNNGIGNSAMAGKNSTKNKNGIVDLIGNRYRYSMIPDNSLPDDRAHHPPPAVLQSSILNNEPGHGEIIGINPPLPPAAAPESPPVSPASKSITSLIADQSFEREYRDDPVTPPPTKTAGGTDISKRPKSKPKVIFNEDDLSTTESMTIDKVEPCGEDQGGYADLVVLVTSAVVNFDARAAIRETWGKFAVERGAFLYFLLGGTVDEQIQKRVLEEDQQYGDILQGSFQDHYYNLTLKTITMMRWVAEKCAKIRYVLKVDDDMVVNMQHACDFTEINPNFHRVIIGKLAKKWRPHRSPASKWYVPYSAYSKPYFPNFVTGPAYFFTGDAARPLWETAINRTIPFYLEDVYMTGIVAEKAGIKRFNHVMMRNIHINKLNQCTFPHVMTSHKYTPEQIRSIWKTVYTPGGDGQKCPQPVKTTAQSSSAAARQPSKPKAPEPPAAATLDSNKKMTKALPLVDLNSNDKTKSDASSSLPSAALPNS